LKKRKRRKVGTKKMKSAKKKVKKEEDRNALWITIVIHSVLGVGEQ
jgi:hypothetical protein